MNEFSVIELFFAVVFSDCAVKWSNDWVKMELMTFEITLSLKELIGTTLVTVSCYWSFLQHWKSMTLAKSSIKHQHILSFFGIISSVNMLLTCPFSCRSVHSWGQQSIRHFKFWCGYWRLKSKRMCAELPFILSGHDINVGRSPLTLMRCCYPKERCSFSVRLKLSQLIIIITCSAIWGKGHQWAPSSHHNSGPVLAVLPMCSHFSSCLPLGHEPTSFLVGSSSFSPEGSWWGIAKCDVRWGLLKGVANPLALSLKDVNFYRLL